MPKSVFVIDDSATMRKVFEMTFAGEDIAVVTHGTILSLYASRAAGLADTFAFWKSLKLPDAILLEGNALERLTWPPDA